MLEGQGPQPRPSSREGAGRRHGDRDHLLPTSMTNGNAGPSETARLSVHLPLIPPLIFPSFLDPTQAFHSPRLPRYPDL